MKTKYINLFENHEAASPAIDLAELATLRDVVNSEHFDWDDARDDYLSALEAARWTCAQFGIAEPVGANRLMELGLIELDGLVERLELDEVIEVFNSMSTSWHDAPKFKSLVHKFPDLLSINHMDGDLQYNDRKAKRLAFEEFDTLSAETCAGPDSGVKAVMWEGDHHVAIYMLRKDLLAG